MKKMSPSHVMGIGLLFLVLLPTYEDSVEESFVAEATPLEDIKAGFSSWMYLFQWSSLSKGDIAYQHVWPDLKFKGPVVLGTIIGFLGACFGSVGGVGGGGIFVPMLTLIVGFDQKSSTALSKCMVMGASAATVWYNFRLKHPTKTSPVIDYDLALLFQPMLMLGISIGVILNVIFPNWMVTVLLIILFTVTSTRTFFKAIAAWRKETAQQKEDEEERQATLCCEEGFKDGDYIPLQDNENDVQGSVCFNTNWKGISLLLFVWISFLFLQILKSNSRTCSFLYWMWNIFQIPVALSIFLKEAISLHKRSKVHHVEEKVFACSAEVHWTIGKLALCAAAGICAGGVGGLLGLGGGFILGPLFLELNVPPQVSGATATFVMLFSSSMSVIEYYFLHRFPVPFALYLFAVSVLAGFCGQCGVRRLINLLGRASLIIFILSLVVFISAISLGGFGIHDSIIKLQNKEYMGFLSLCHVESP